MRGFNGIELIGVIAQGDGQLPARLDRPDQPRQGLCLPITTNYIACWIDSIRQNNFDILKAYRRKLFQFRNDPDIVDLFHQNKKLMTVKNDIFPQLRGAPGYSVGASMYRTDME